MQRTASIVRLTVVEEYSRIRPFQNTGCPAHRAELVVWEHRITESGITGYSFKLSDCGGRVLHYRETASRRTSVLAVASEKLNLERRLTSSVHKCTLYGNSYLSYLFLVKFNMFLLCVIEGKTKWNIEVTGRRGRRLSNNWMTLR